MADQIICPNCKTPITVTEALSSQLKADLEMKLQKELAVKEKAFAEQTQKLKEKEEELNKQQTQLEKEVAEQTAKKLEAAKKEMWAKAQEKASEKFDLELKAAKEELEERRKQTEEFAKKELEFLREKRRFDDEKRKLELEVVKRVETERQQIAEKIEKEAEERMRLTLLEKEKQLADTQKALEEAQRKAKQGSQQNQGEVLELDLEQTLRETFVRDLVEPVGKGVQGADIVQCVCDNAGGKCGVILWEVKQTKNWTEGWIAKFKDDLRSQNADIPVLVTTSLPKEVEGFGYYKNVWVTSPKFALPLAIALRKNLLSVAYERTANANKGEKAELLYSYVASNSFRHRVEALVEVFQEMQEQIVKEQTAFEKSWKQREGQVKRLMLNMAGMYGEMQGLVGSTMPEIKGLEFGQQRVLSSDNKEEGKLF